MPSKDSVYHIQRPDFEPELAPKFSFHHILYDLSYGTQLL